MMLEWAKDRGLFIHILLTKADKLNRGPANTALLEVKTALKKMKLDFSIQLFSSLDKQGLPELAMVMAGRLNYVLDEFGKAIDPIENTLDYQENSLLHPDIDMDDSGLGAIDMDSINLDDIPEVSDKDLD
jgi:GTP-binding protein